MSDVGFGFLGSGNMATVYADALATQVTGGRFVASWRVSASQMGRGPD